MFAHLFEKKARFAIYAIMAVVLLAVVLVCFCCGRLPLQPHEVFGAFVAKLTGQPIDHNTDLVIFSLRMPRIVLSLFVGAGLACAGAAYQSLFSNPLATPDTLGVSGGAAVGAVVGLLLDFPMPLVQIVAFATGALATGITIVVARVQGEITITRLILAGVIVTSLMNAVISIVKLVADPADQLPEITYWLMGGLTGATRFNLVYGIIGIGIGIAGIFLLRWRLNVLSLGEEEARSSGTPVTHLRVAIICFATLISATVVALCGQVGWVGLVIPHCARLICGTNNRSVVPVSILLGALFMLVVDTFARSALAMEIPLSILTAFIGAPVFIVLLRKSGRHA